MKYRIIPAILGAICGYCVFDLVNRTFSVESDSLLTESLEGMHSLSKNSRNPYSFSTGEMDARARLYPSIRLPPQRRSEEWDRSWKSLEAEAAEAFDDDQSINEAEAHRPRGPAGFFQENCKIDVPSSRTPQSWWPSKYGSNETAISATQSDKNWRERAPGFLVIGAKKAGTSSIAQWLGSHNQVANSKKRESLFFMPRKIPERFWEYDFVKRRPKTSVNVDIIRSVLDEQLYPVPQIRQNPKLQSFEATADYMLFSTLSRIPILCSFPWVKLVVVLREPIDRAYSNFMFMRKYAEAKRAKEGGTSSGHDRRYESFEQYITDDMTRLQKLGLIPQEAWLSARISSSVENHSRRGQNTTATTLSRPKERHAWLRYQQAIAKSTNSPIGRSLYVVQLEEWFESLRQLGRDPAKEVLILRYEDLQTNADTIYTRLENFLGLDALEVLPNLNLAAMDVDQFGPAEALSPKTRSQLESIFAPYNKRLYELLGWEKSEEGADISDPSAVNKQWKYGLTAKS